MAFLVSSPSHQVKSIKILDPQFSGQTKERLSSRECASFVANTIKDAFSLWLNQHTSVAENIAELAIMNAQSRTLLRRLLIQSVTH
jgi:topoisomerase-4 subunit B